MTKHGHGLPRKRPNRSAKDEINDELPELEPVIEDLPGLEFVEEAADPSGVRARIQASDEKGFDWVVAVDVPEMEKAKVGAAVEGPLARRLTEASARLRHRRVVVAFGGAALIGSAVKELVGKLLQPHRPLLGVVRRGFGDETVCEGKLPEVQVVAKDVDGTGQVEVETGDGDAADLPIALERHLEALGKRAAGKRVVFQFRGAARPDADVRALLGKTMREAGARSASIGARVLFDKDIEDKVRCAVGAGSASVVVQLDGDDAAIVDSLSLVLPNLGEKVSGKDVRLEFQRDSEAVRAFAVDWAKQAGAKRITVGEQECAEVVWPPVLAVTAGDEVHVAVQPNGRNRAALLQAFRHECRSHHAVTQGKRVVIDWPAGFACDDDVVTLLRDVQSHLAAKRVACTVAGENREPFWPEPVQTTVDGDVRVLRLDSEAGKPPELQRAVDRRLPAFLKDVRGKSVRVRIAGQAALSRTLLNGLLEAVAGAGAMRLELDEGDRIDVLLPPLLTIADSKDGMHITAVVDGRNEDQLQRALERELADVLVPADAAVTVHAGPLLESLTKALLERGATRLVLDGAQPVQIHPPLLSPPKKQARGFVVACAAVADESMAGRMLERELAGFEKAAGAVAGGTVTIVAPGRTASSPVVERLVNTLVDKKVSKVAFAAGEATIDHAEQLHPAKKPEPTPAAATRTAAVPAAAPAAAPAKPAAPPPARAAAPTPSGAASTSRVTLLGRRDEAVPPLVVLGVHASEQPEDLAQLESELASHVARLRGRAALFVLRHGEADVPVRRSNAVVELLGRVVPQGAAATLVFRGPDAQGRPHFQVLHSTLRALPVGSAFADPRARA
jgi:hypothetical protein